MSSQNIPELVEELSTFLDKIRAADEIAKKIEETKIAEVVSQLKLEYKKVTGNDYKGVNLKSRLGSKQHGQSQYDLWKEFKGKLMSNNDGDIRQILVHEFVRKESILKDQNKKEYKDQVFRHCTFKDTILNKVLRSSAPDKVLKKLTEKLPSYAKSKLLFDIVSKTVLTDDRWISFKDECRALEEDDDISLDDIEQIFKIRHTREEHTILALAVRKNPPPKVIQAILRGNREALSFPDNPRCGWIPLHYALQFQASSEVTKALIPTESDRNDFDSLKEFDVMKHRDYRDRNLLHWAAYHNASLDTIEALKKACPISVLETQDHCKHLPYQTAIWHGRPAHIIEAFFLPGGKNGHESFEEVLERLIRSLTDKNESRKMTKDEQAKDTKASCVTDECTEDGCRPSLKKYLYSSKSLFTESTRYDLKKHYTYMHYDLHSIAARISDNKLLQRAVVERTCNSSAVLLSVTEFYNCILLILSYYFCSQNALLGEDVTLNATAWLITLSITIGHMIFREITDVLTAQARWFSIWNIFDSVTIFLLVASVIRMSLGQTDGNFATLVVITTGFIWMDAIFFLRSTFISFAVFVSGIFKIIKDLVPFFVVSIFVLTAFAQMFLLEHIANDRCGSDAGTQESRYLRNADGGNTTGTLCTLEDSFYVMYGLFVGGIEIEDYSETALMGGIAVFFGFLVAIILLNVVIAILSNSWDDVMKESKRVYWEHKLEFLITVKKYQEFYSNFSCFGLCCRREDGKVSFQTSMDTMDRQLAKLCQPFWPGGKYFGNFESMFDRICGDGPGSFQVQLIYEFTVKKGKWLGVLLKSIILMTIFWSTALLWFIAGMLTFGLLWPRAIREFIFGQVLTDDGETEESSNVETSPKESVQPIQPRDVIVRKKMLPNDVLSRLQAINDEVGQLLCQTEDDYSVGSDLSSTPDHNFPLMPIYEPTEASISGRRYFPEQSVILNHAPTLPDFRYPQAPTGTTDW